MQRAYGAYLWGVLLYPLVVIALIVVGFLIYGFSQLWGSKHGSSSFSEASVRSAFAVARVPLTQSFDTGDETVLAPSDYSFTVFVVNSDSKAEGYYKQYEGLKTPDSFQLLAVNVIV